MASNPLKTTMGGLYPTAQGMSTTPGAFNLNSIGGAYTTAGPGYFYGPQTMQSTPAYTPEQMQAMQNTMLDALHYSQIRFRANWEAPKTLETRALSPRERAELEKDLPF